MKQPPTTHPDWTYQVAGDSVTYQALAATSIGGGGGDPHGANTTHLVGIGWEAKHAQPRLDANVADPPPTRSPRIFAMAFGQNYADRFGQAESAQLLTMAFSVHPATAVVIVLPSRRTDNPTAAWNVQRVRQDLATIYQARLNAGSPTVLVDWFVGNVQQHPEYLAPDGVHLSSADTNGDGRWDAAVAFADMLWAGHQECEGLLS